MRSVVLTDSQARQHVRVLRRAAVADPEATEALVALRSPGPRFCVLFIGTLLDSMDAFVYGPYETPEFAMEAVGGVWGDDESNWLVRPVWHDLMEEDGAGHQSMPFDSWDLTVKEMHG